MAKARKASKIRAPKGRKVFDELKDLVTEKTNSSTKNIDRRPTEKILRLINREDAVVAGAVEKEILFIAQAVEMVVGTFKAGGRLFYLGAGTSGRLGVLDAAECPPTFGTDPASIVGIIAGGYRSLIRSREGVEDNMAASRADIRKHRIGPKDMVIGITASKRTPYVLAGLREAKELGAATVFICCNPRQNVAKEFDLAICPLVGPEVIAGSSRMKSGTAQKMILNMITTAAMIRTGRVYGNRMVDLKATSEKLKERSKKVLVDVCRIDYNKAERLLRKAGGSVKTAIVMSKAPCSKSKAEKLLKFSGGFVHKALSPTRKNM